MLKRILRATTCGLLLMFLPSMGLAQGNSQGKGKGHNKQADQNDNDRDGDRGGRIVFSVRDRDTIRNYYQDRNSNLPPGLAKRNGNLPPGLQKHLERDGTLPRIAEAGAAISRRPGAPLAAAAGHLSSGHIGRGHSDSRPSHATDRRHYSRYLEALASFLTRETLTIRKRRCLRFLFLFLTFAVPKSFSSATL